MSNRNDGTGSNEEKSAMAFALSLGFGIAVPLALFIVSGVWLDGLLNTTPLFVLIGIFLGLFSAGYFFWRLIVASEPGNKRN
ncbi:AtpZ/AtpI family protein [Candidatus Chlorohelix sp.]|uniref:AtpZ/AtpI family protein n=1 Tax=Candidatus Chlorohelix sp. TaxID=3139201 RepID=UPI00304D85CD